MLRFGRPLLTRLVLLAGAAALAVPTGVGLATVDLKRRTEQLRRPIVEMPEAAAALSDPRAAIAQALDHLADRSLGVIGAARTTAWTRYEILGDPGGENVVRSGDLVFLTDHDLFGTRQFRAMRAACKPGGAEAGWVGPLVERVRTVRDAVAAPGRRVGVLGVPSKPMLYADRLPVSVPAELRAACAAAARQTGWARRLADAVEDASTRVVYPVEAFRAMRDREGFYPPQNFHTEGASAHIAAWRLLDALWPGEFPPGGPGFHLADGQADMKGVYTYARTVPLLRVGYREMRARRVAPQEERDWRRRYPGIPGIRVFRREGMTTGRRAVVIGNSFSLHVAPHLATGFDETVLAYTNGIGPRGAREILEGLIPEVEPDAVLFVFHDAGLKRGGPVFRILADAARDR